ncbi:wax ester/triacylglycerol synthase domain-containing protein [Streptomyces hyaluromycini]|uniref:wax ester/triacylglycerol synthase domain-containing protein n=1 Tax=Streptomyces hyaluromycini TaxID=1377993 RepID=UPI00142DEE2B|nr:wax ester/triacylglycerol synthase domain-containing protein [Streptomyces hyaluromycini]
MNRFPDPSPADLVMVKAEQLAEHPDANSTVGAVLHLTGDVPDLAALREHVTARLADLPCLTHVLTGDGPTAQWTPAAPDMARHVRDRQVASAPEALEATVRLLLQEPWAEGAPAWRMILLHGHTPDGFALLYLTHHAVQDGANVVTVMEALFGPRLLPEQFSVPTRDICPIPRPRLCQVLRSTVTLLRHARRHRLWQSASHPLSSRRHTMWTQVPSAGLRTAARAAGASTNDVYLTAVAHAITQWAYDAWPRAAGVSIPVMVPVNLRTPDEAGAPGNRLFLARIDLPGGTMPMGRRLARAQAVTTPLKSAGHKTVLRAALTRLPQPLLRRLVAVGTVPGRLTVCASYLVVRRRLHYGEAAVRRIDPVICCPPGVPMAIAAVSYEGTTSACFRIDRALPGADSLPARWRQALADLVATASPVPGCGPAPAGHTPAGRTPDGRATPVVRALLTWLAQRPTAADTRRR